MQAIEHIFHNKEQLYRTIQSQHPFPSLKELENYKKLKTCIEIAAKPCCSPRNIAESCEKVYYKFVKSLTDDQILQLKHICQCNKLKFIFDLNTAPDNEKDFTGYEVTS